MPNKHMKNYSFYYFLKKLNTTVHLPNWHRFAIVFAIINNVLVLMKKLKNWHSYTLLVGV